MKKEFLEYIRKENLFSKKERILLAVSGGRDSVVMAELFSVSGFRFAIAHCNFSLRGKESEGDEKFTRELAERLHVSFYVRRFPAIKYAKQHKLSLQMAARELRYAWFESLCKIKKYDRLATAHHCDDAVETFFINLLRGNGLKGLSGLKPRNGNRVRPLMFAGRKQINEFITKKKIAFREDSSNLEDNYVRNKLRLKVIPLLREINPGLENTILETSARMGEADAFIRDAINKNVSRMVKHKNGKTFISIEQIRKTRMEKLYLFYLLSPFGFTNDRIREISQSLASQSGKWFFSGDYDLLRDRTQLVISKKKKASTLLRKILPGEKEISEPVGLHFESRKVDKKFRIPAAPDIACLDLSLLKFPLVVRRWKPGDSFFPLGLGHRKKLSDFLINLKLSGFDKKEVFVLVSGGEIAWVIGYRMDDRYKITPKTRNALVCTRTVM